MNRICIKNGNVVFPSQIKKVNIICEDGKIVDLVDFVPDECMVIDAGNKLINPGFVEIHAHGGGGNDFCDCTTESFENIIKTHLRHGTTLICPTLVSSKLDRIMSTFDVYRLVKNGVYGKYMHKMHLEGPYLNIEMCGAQRPDIIRCPSKNEVDIIFDKASDIIGRIGCAPEIDGVDYLAKKAANKNILLSIAHSGATAKQTKKAMDIGFSHVTHLKL